MYIKRHMEDTFLHMSGFFKAVLVTGARQVGKTTMLRHLGKDRTYVSMDNAENRELARQDPQLFFMRYKPPIIIDEVQKAPELFPYIKIMCDNSDERGLFWLTGSEQFSLMSKVRESLAGRIGIMTLYPLSYAEYKGVKFASPLRFDMQSLLEREKSAPPMDLTDRFEFIWRGGMPALKNADNKEHYLYYSSYTDAYLMRDVASVSTVYDENAFAKFISACAANTACQLNLTTLAQSSGISVPTAKSWLDILIRLHIVMLLQPYANNKLKRLAKTPKLYFIDTGFAAHLCRWLNDISYYRDSNSKEIDVFLQTDNVIHPLEIKLSSSPNNREVKKYSVLDNNSIARGEGGIICMSPTVIPLDKTNCLIPVTLL